MNTGFLRVGHSGALALLCVLAGAAAGAVGVHADVGDHGDFPVGHSMLKIVLTGSNGEARPIDVHVWYPADEEAYAISEQTVYRSRLFGVTLIPGTFDPLSFEFSSTVAREDAQVDSGGPLFPLLLFSHGSTNSPFDYAFTLEVIASHGYVVAAPEHTGDTADDVLVNMLNNAAGTIVLPCLDGLPRPCTDPANKNIRDRARDLTAIVNEFEAINSGMFSNRIDMTRIGAIGHSRGGVAAVLSVSGGSLLGIAADPRVTAAMGMATGSAIFDAASAADLANTTAPVSLMVGELDGTAPVSVTLQAYDALANAPRTLAVIRGGHHRSFDSTYCAQMQAAAAIAQSNPRAILEDRTARRILVQPTSGSALDYCSFDAFVDPADIRPYVLAVTGFRVTQDNVARTTDSDEVSRLASLLGVEFFDATLDATGNEGLLFTRHLTPNFLLQHEENVTSASTSLAQGARCPEMQGCVGRGK